jgi:hypothetical protein
MAHISILFEGRTALMESEYLSKLKSVVSERMHSIHPPEILVNHAENS